LSPSAGEEWDSKRGSIRAASAEIARRIDEGRLADRHWRMLLTETQVIRARDRWPAGEDLVIAMRRPRWLGLREVRVQANGGQASCGALFPGCGFGTDHDVRMEQRQSLGAIPAGTRRLELDVNVVQADIQADLESDSFGNTASVWSGRVSLPLRAVADAADVIPIVESDGVDLAVRNCSSIKLMDDWLTVLVDREPEIDDLAIGFKAEILRNGAVIHEFELRDEVLSDGRVYASGRYMAMFDGLEQGRTHEIQPTDVLRLRADPIASLSDWDATRIWGGEISIPWQDIEVFKRESPIAASSGDL
jgi:hypothetical protein